MKGNVVTAAKWLGASLVLASVILVGGLYWILSSHIGRLTETVRPNGEATATASSAHRFEEASPRYLVYPPQRAELFIDSENLRKAGEEWEAQFHDQPSRVTPFSTRGGWGP